MSKNLDEEEPETETGNISSGVFGWTLIRLAKRFGHDLQGKA
jgi:hypothetical protein